MSDSASTCSEGSQQMFCDVDEAAEDWSLAAVQTALEKLEKMSLAEQPKSVLVGAHKRRGELLYALSNHEQDRKKRVEVLENALKASEEGHALQPKCFEILKLLCSTTGRLAEESSITKKVQYGLLFKTYLDKALAIDSDNFELLHMRGRFNYTVANLSLMEKLAAKVMGTVPNVTYEDALEDLLKAEQTMGGVVENELFIGKTYIAMGNYADAKVWLKMAAESEVDDTEAVEIEHIAEARQLLTSKNFR